MVALATLSEVKAVAQADTNIQNLKNNCLAVVNAFSLAEKVIKAAHFGDLAKEAQIYYVAHILSMAATVAGGRGPLSSESIGGVTQSFTLPYLNRATVIASTQYGLMYLEIRDQVIVPALIVKPT